MGNPYASLEEHVGEYVRFTKTKRGKWKAELDDDEDHGLRIYNMTYATARHNSYAHDDEKYVELEEARTYLDVIELFNTTFGGPYE